jgi:TolB-like protein/Tfp pilus assembly protein PilF
LPEGEHYESEAPLRTPAALLDRVRQRKLGQWALAYLAGAWVVLQLIAMAAQPFAWPDLVVRAAWVLLATGFLVVLVLAWYHGERGQQRASGIELLMLAALLGIAGIGVALVSRSGVTPPAAASATVGAAALAATDAAGETSVVVLPFIDISPQRDQEYFADGLTEEILNALVRLPGLRVPARTTSFSFKGKDVPVSEIAQQLGVAHVLEGSVRRDGDRLRITAQLVDARSDRHLWSERFDRGIADVFAVQEEIAQAVAAALQLRLATAPAAAGGQGDRTLVTAGTSDPAAYEMYLRGLHAWNRRTPESLRQAIAHFERAVALDPSFARGWAGLALTYVLIPEYTDTLPAAWTPRARDAAGRALALDPTLAEAHTALAWAHSLEWNFALAEREFQRALELNPSFPTAHQWYGSFQNAMGRPADARRSFERALELDPLSFIIAANLADQLFYERRYPQALARYEQAFEVNPEGGNLYRAQYALALLHAGQEAKALAEVDALVGRVDEGSLWAYVAIGCVLAKSQRASEARAMAARLEARARSRYVSQGNRAYLQVCLGEIEHAFALLAEAEAVRDLWLFYYMANDPVLDPLRADSRFARLRQRFSVR